MEEKLKIKEMMKLKECSRTAIYKAVKRGDLVRTYFYGKPLFNLKIKKNHEWKKKKYSRKNNEHRT